MKEALGYLDRSLNGGFRPGMGHVMPDRLFWAQPEDDPTADADGETAGESASDTPGPNLFFELPDHATKH